MPAIGEVNNDNRHYEVASGACVSWGKDGKYWVEYTFNK